MASLCCSPLDMAMIASFIFSFLFFGLLLSSGARIPSQVPVNTTWTLQPNPEAMLMVFDGFKDISVTFVSPASSAAYYLSLGTDWEELPSQHTTWVANTESPVYYNATLSFRADGNLVLSQGVTQVWTSNTSGLGAVAMELQEPGNLVLLNSNGGIIWQSFDHPTHTLFRDQPFRLGSKLTSSVSETNPKAGSFYLQLEPHRLVAYAKAPVAPQPYMVWDLGSHPVSYLKPSACSLDAYDEDNRLIAFQNITSEFCLNTQQYVKLFPDGDFRARSFHRSWSIIRPISDRPESKVPGACGKYTVIRGRNCSCLDFDPSLKYIPADISIPEAGCLPTEPVTKCSSNYVASSYHLVESNGYDYLPLQYMQGQPQSSVIGCKQSCILSCTCVAAFVHQFGVSNSTCFHMTELYTLETEPLASGYASTLFLKAKVAAAATGRQDSNKPLKVVAKVAISAFSIIIAASTLVLMLILYWRRRLSRVSAVEEDLPE